MKNEKKAIAIFAAVTLGMTTFASLAFNNEGFLTNGILSQEQIMQNMIATPANAETAKQYEKATKSNAMKQRKDFFTGFKTVDGSTFFYEAGNKVVSEFCYFDGELYYFDDEGKMVTGWFIDEHSGNLYYFENDGASKSGWILEDGIWYYLEDFKCVTGWKEILTEDGESCWFYFDQDGKMYANCETPDGYFVNEDGVWVEDTDFINQDEYEDGFEWDWDPDKEPGELSGLSIADHPAEFYMLCIAGETSGLANISAVKNGDRGCAYGACQLDYRFDLVNFMNFAYKKHPQLWNGFLDYLTYRNGNPELKGNSQIGNTFLEAMKRDYETAMTDQLEFMATEYWNDFAHKMDAAGFNLENRHIAVSAALFSINVNCGPQANIFIQHLSPNMSDEELIRGIYKLRNTVFAKQKVGSAFKGTSTRYKSSEPQMALDLLYGYVTIDSNVNYGGGVEWHGNPFSDAITTISSEERVLYNEKHEEEDKTENAIKRKISLSEDISDEKNIGISEETYYEEMEEELESELEAEEMSVPETVEYEAGNENIVQLSDGSWVDARLYGPGYEYMPAKETIEQETEIETEFYEIVEIEETTESLILTE